MNTERPATAVIAPAAPTSAGLRGMAVVLAASAFVAACAHVALPLYFTPVPLTLQPFAVLLLGLLLSPRMAGAAIVAYLGEGMLGLPVFAPGPASTPGFSHLFGPTAGYLLAYPFAAMLVAFVYRRTDRGFVAAALTAAAGDVVILSMGAIWLGMLTHLSARGVLAQAVVPFLPGDALKVIAAASLAAAWFRWRRRTASPQ